MYGERITENMGVAMYEYAGLFFGENDRSGFMEVTQNLITQKIIIRVGSLSRSGFFTQVSRCRRDHCYQLVIDKSIYNVTTMLLKKHQIQETESGL